MSVPQNILVVGASGFIGKSLCEHLKNVWPTSNIHALARKTSDVAKYVQKHVLYDWSLEGIIEGVQGFTFDVIFNLAASGVSPSDRELTSICAVNTVLPSTLVQLAHQHNATLIHAGSSAEYAMTTDLYLDEIHSPLGSDTLYGASKAAGGMLALATAKHLNVNFLNLRLFNVFGAGEASHRLFPSLVNAARSAKPLALSDGLQIRDFIHIQQVCNAFELAVTHSVNRPQQSVLNICSGEAVSVKDFSLSIFEMLSADPKLLKFGVIERRPDDLLRVVGNPERAASGIGFRTPQALTDIISHAFSVRMDAA